VVVLGDGVAVGVGDAEVGVGTGVTGVGLALGGAGGDVVHAAIASATAGSHARRDTARRTRPGYVPEAGAPRTEVRP